ncbi:MAG TPA: VCBS repeat-containing protein [Pyrinomonadaceae bacterium]
MKQNLIVQRLCAALILSLALWLSGGPVARASDCVRGASTTFTGALEAVDPDQTGRVFRTSVPSTCGFQKTTPNAAGGTQSFNYDQYTFTNPNNFETCVTVDVNFTGCGASAAINATSMVAYLGSFNPANPLQNYLGDMGLSTIGGTSAPYQDDNTQSFSFTVPANATYVLVVYETVSNGLCASYSFTHTLWTNCRADGPDFGKSQTPADGKADLAVWRSGTSGDWLIKDSASGNNFAQLDWGRASLNDVNVAADYDGDSKTDLAVWRPSDGNWYIIKSTNGLPSVTNWGQSGDIPVPGDYDRDSKTDVAVWRPSDGNWYIRQSSNGSGRSINWGESGDRPVVGDFDGDLATDEVVFRPSEGTWLIRYSNFPLNLPAANPGVFARSVQWGSAGDKLVPADYDGDGRTDVAVYRPSEGNWYIRLGGGLGGTTAVGAGLWSTSVINWGDSSDVLVPADYDGDKKADVAVWRPSNGNWYVRNSGGGATVGPVMQFFGPASGDLPVQAAFIPQPQ